MPQHPCDTGPGLRVGSPLPAAFFDRDPRAVAPALLGTVLVSHAGGTPTGGIIAETEAYLGTGDEGSHAATRGMTARNSAMYGPPGTIYVYFTYGAHHMVNLVCGPEGEAGAVLIRAIEPVIELDVMRARRAGRPDAELANGPGKLTEALGIDLTHNRSVLGAGELVVHDAALPGEIIIATSGRVGLTKGYELPLRFFIDGSPFVSRGRTGRRPQGRSSHNAP